MSTVASQITSVSIVCLTAGSGRDHKKTSKLCITGPCEGNSPLTHEFPAQKTSTMENVSIWWRHHELGQFCRQQHISVYFTDSTVGSTLQYTWRCYDMETLLCYWRSVREIHWSLVDSPYKGPVMKAFDFSLNKLLNSQLAGYLTDTGTHVVTGWFPSQRASIAGFWF